MIDESNKEQPWETCCPSCGGTCPEIQKQPDGSLFMRDSHQAPGVVIHLSRENLKEMFSKWMEHLSSTCP